MYQKLIIAGYLGRDPEMRFTKDGTPVANFSVATSRKWTGKDSVKHDETTWFRVSAWRKLGEVCAEYLQKGHPVLIEGRLNADENGNPRIWTDKNDNPRASFEITAETVQFLGGRNDSGGNVSEGPPAADESSPEIPF